MGRFQRVIAISGANGRLGRRLLMEFSLLNQATSGPSREALNWADLDSVRRFLAERGPAIVVALASFTDVSAAERLPLRLKIDTIDTALTTAKAAQELGLPCLYVSTDYVVPLLRGEDGCAYAVAKRKAESAVLAHQGQVVRLAFTTPEQVAGWQWVNDYSLANRNWVEDAARELAQYVVGGEWESVAEIGPPMARTPANLLRGRYPHHSALLDTVVTPKEMHRRVGYAAPKDSRFWQSSRAKMTGG